MNRVQTLRSSTTGNVPAAGTRQPGELWANFVDLQFGVVDASKNAQKLVAVRYFSSSANYVTGDFVVQAGKIYVANGAITAGAFNGTQWTALADSAGYLPLAGGTLTGKLTLSGPPTNPLDAATKAYADGVSAALYLPLAGGTLTGPLNGAGASFSGNITGTNGSIIVRGVGTAVAGFNIANAGGTGVANFLYTPTTGTAAMSNGASSPVASLALDGGGSFTYTGSGTALKAGGGAWAATSDARIKTVEGDYAVGLSEVMGLQPVRYRYKGNDAAPKGVSAHAGVTERSFVGLIAQAVETVMPGMVTQGEGWIDGAKVTDFRSLDTTELIFALVNAVKTLTARVEALEPAKR